MTNQAKIWTVVKPTVGLPLFLGGVATIAVLVHLALLSHTGWYGAYWNGAYGKTAHVAASEPAATPAPSESSVDGRGRGRKIPARFFYWVAFTILGAARLTSGTIATSVAKISTSSML